MTHGQKESILFARANSSAAALCGLEKIKGEGAEGLPGWRLAPASPDLISSNDGERSGDEKERRYRAMKKTSFKQQNMNRTV